MRRFTLLFTNHDQVVSSFAALRPANLPSIKLCTWRVHNIGIHRCASVAPLPLSLDRRSGGGGGGRDLPQYLLLYESVDHNLIHQSTFCYLIIN